MTRRKIARVRDPKLRALYRAVHAAPKGQLAKRQKELRMGVAEMLKAGK